LDTRTARERLVPRGKPYYRSVRSGLHLGYRKGQGQGRWVARVYVGDGTYKVETIGTADDRVEANGRDVLDYAQALKLADAAQARYCGQIKGGGPYSVADAVRDYFAHLEHLGKRTGDARNRADVHILPKLGEIVVARLTAARLREWLSAMADAPARVRAKRDAEPAFRETADNPDARRSRRASANRTLTVLKAALNLAWREGRVADDKAWRSVKPFAQADAARVRYLQVSEAKRLLNACKSGFRDLATAALQTGCRYGELAALRVEDFNPDAGTIAIRRSKSGKGRHVYLTDEGAAFFSQLTAGRAGSELMLRNEARLARSIATVKRERKRRGAAGDDTPIELSDDGAWRASEQVREIAKANANAKIDPPASFHSLRHTWASLSVMAGVPLMVVARNLGHADTRMVEKHYGHLAPSYVADAIRAGAPKFGAIKRNNLARLEVA
jgi:integrase